MDEVANLREELARARELLRDYIIEREEAQDALEESEERYRSLIERAYYGIYRSTTDGRFLEVNSALVSMLGYSTPEELLAIDIGRQLYAHADARSQLVEPVLRGEAVPDWFETRWLRKDGSSLTVRVTARPRYRRDGTIEYFEGIVEDVTARERQEELLRRSERMASLGTTLAGVAHELNNPLTAVIGFAQIMLRGEHTTDDRVALETIHREAVRAARIVKDLLTFTRRQEGTKEDRIDLNAIAEYIMSTRRYALETSGVRCTMKLTRGIPPVVGDPSQLEQVLLNLLVNAEQAMAGVLDAPHTAGQDSSPRGEITIATWATDSEVSVSIADTGCGIPADDLPRIWDPFWTTKSEGEGTGLGLAVVHGIVNALGGTIEVVSEVGRGTTFTMSFPAASEARTSSAPVTRPVTSQAARPLDVLVIDDESSIRNFLSQYLASRGHAVLVAESGSQALSIAKQGDFDVVVCDLRMPGMDGIETMRALRALPNGKASRLILSTGATLGNAIHDAAKALRIAAVVPKPYDIEQLRKAIEQA